MLSQTNYTSKRSFGKCGRLNGAIIIQNTHTPRKTRNQKNITRQMRFYLLRQSLMAIQSLKFYSISRLSENPMNHKRNFCVATKEKLKKTTTATTIFCNANLTRIFANILTKVRQHFLASTIENYESEE